MIKVAKVLASVLLAILFVGSLLFMFFGAVLQESYKLNPPTEMEVSKK